jgi:hypothetical protein
MINKSIKVTVQNVTKLSEDYLYNILSDLSETHPDFDLIDSELSRRASLIVRSTEVAQQLQIETLTKFHQAQDEIIEILSGYRGKKTIFLIEKLGNEFIDDYEICFATFTVRSFVARPTQSSEWFHDDIEEAKAKYAKLLYYRIYDHYLRYASQENVEKIRLALGV